MLPVVTRAACPRGAGRQPWQPPALLSLRTQRLRLTWRAACAHADGATGAMTAGPPPTAADPRAGGSAGAPSCVMADDAWLGFLLHAMAGSMDTGACASVQPERQVCQGPQRLMPSGFAAGGASAGRLRGAVADQSVSPLQRVMRAAARVVAALVRRRVPVAYAGCGITRCATPAGAVLQRVARLKPALLRTRPASTCAGSRQPIGHAETGTPRSEQRRQRGCPDAGAPVVSAGLSVAGAPGVALAAVPEMGLGPGWLRSQPAQPSIPMISSTAAGREQRLQVTVPPCAGARARVAPAGVPRPTVAGCPPCAGLGQRAMRSMMNARALAAQTRREGMRNAHAIRLAHRASTRP